MIERWHRGCDWFGTRGVPLLAPWFNVTTRVASDQPLLTFDDGPDPRTTPHLLDVLDRHQQKATFFVVGERAERFPNFVREITRRGHDIGNHSWSHAMPWRQSAAAQTADYDRTHWLLRSLVGNACVAVRPPYGMHTPALARWSRRMIQPVWLWSVMPPDYRNGCPDDRVRRDLKRSRAGDIVCLHERKRTAGLLNRYLSELPASSSNTPAISTGQTAVASQWTSANCPPSASGTNLPQLTPSE